MLSFRHRGVQLCDGLNRREWLRVGGLSAVGLSLPQLLAAQRAVAAPAAAPKLASGLSGAMFGKAKNVIFLWMQGGPPQHETFDPKPDAPLEIRGPFKPVQTNVPGIQYCELLPRTAQRADKLAIIRSLSTDDNNHDVSGYWVLTGYPYGPGTARQIKPTDWPYMGSVIKMMKPSERLPALTSVWLPDMMRLNDNVTPAGQTSGFLGSMWEPERFVGDPAAGNYRIEGLSLPIDLPPQRMSDRAALLGELNRGVRDVDGMATFGGWSKLSRFALDLVTSGQAKEAFDLSREPDALRDKYGRHTWGQSCLLARRLIEAGTRLVHVNWPREPGDNAVDNPMWDTHVLNADRLQDTLCPIFDVTFAALLDDLEARGLLSETLVVAVGEFGRTPKINGAGGRDHWGPVFNAALAGAGIAGGQVFGASDKNGAYPTVDPIRPHDLTATIFHLLGIHHDDVFHDRTNRPQPLTKGEPLYRLLGDQPATVERCASTADEKLVPPFNTTPLMDTNFALQNLVPIAPVTREKGWRGAPLATLGSSGMLTQVSADPRSHGRIGLFGTLASAITVPAGSKGLLAQEIKNARGGQYTFTIRADGACSSKAAFDRCFGSLITCRLALLRFGDMQKNPLQAQQLATATFQPAYGESFENPQEFTVSGYLASDTPGVNFSIGSGLGVLILLETRAPLELAAGEAAFLAIQEVRLEFSPHRRNDKVTA